MTNLATFKLENILASDGVTEMKFWENNGIYTVTTGTNAPDFDLYNYGCANIEELKTLTDRNLRRVKENSKNEVLNFLNTL